MKLSRTFGLRSLLLAIFVCAVGLGVYRNRQWPSEVRQVRPGMTVAEIGAAFGRPTKKQGDRSLGMLEYQYEWGRLSIQVRHGRCTGAAFTVTDDWPEIYLVVPDGSIQRCPFLTNFARASKRPGKSR